MFLPGFLKFWQMKVARPSDTKAKIENIVHKLADGRICVLEGTPDLVRQAIEDYAATCSPQVPCAVAVNVFKHPSGLISVDFPHGVPAYALVNLIGWLNQPPDVDGVSGATGWITSPASRVRYSLQPEGDNLHGDTLVGASSEATSVRVYLPDVSVCEISRRIAPMPELEIGSAAFASGQTFTITVDFPSDFGNPAFLITHRRDTRWN